MPEQGGREPVRVLLVDDQESFLAAMREIIEATEDFEIAGQVGSGEAAIEAADHLSPELVVMDKRMPGMGGIEACRVITQQHPEIVVVVASVEEPHPELRESCGAAAVIRKQAISARLLRQIWNGA